MARALAAFVALGCGAVAAPGAARAADHGVTFPATALPGAYTPSAVEAGAGDTVTFTGAFTSHPLAWDAGDFARTPSGTTATFTFSRPGLFRFHCEIHASMTGSVHVAGNEFATPEFTWAPAPVAGRAVTFAATAFADPDGTIARYEWDLDGDGSFESAGAQVAHTYGSPGTVGVRLRYVDDGHETSPATVHAVTIAGTGGGAGGGGGGAGGGGAGGAGGGAGSGAVPPGGSGTPTPGLDGGSTTPAPPRGGGGQGAAPTPPSATAPGLRLTTRALAFRGGAATVALAVTARATATVTLRVGRTVLALGAGRVRPGAARVSVRLTGAGTRRLRRVRTLRATLTAILRAPSGHKQSVRRTVTVRLAR